MVTLVVASDGPNLHVFGKEYLILEPIADLPDNVRGLVAKGELTGDGYATVLMPAVDRTLTRHDKIRILALGNLIRLK